jgi:hypothetical protein
MFKKSIFQAIRSIAAIALLAVGSVLVACNGIERLNMLENILCMQSWPGKIKQMIVIG